LGSNDDSAVFASWIACWVAAGSNVVSNKLFVESVCVWVVNIVVDSSLVLEASWLPEFRGEGAGVVVV